MRVGTWRLLSKPRASEPNQLISDALFCIVREMHNVPVFWCREGQVCLPKDVERRDPASDWIPEPTLPSHRIRGHPLRQIVPELLAPGHGIGSSRFRQAFENEFAVILEEELFANAQFADGHGNGYVAGGCCSA